MCFRIEKMLPKEFLISLVIGVILLTATGRTSAVARSTTAATTTATTTPPVISRPPVLNGDTTTFLLPLEPPTVTSTTTTSAEEAAELETEFPLTAENVTVNKDNGLSDNKTKLDENPTETGTAEESGKTQVTSVIHRIVDKSLLRHEPEQSSLSDDFPFSRGFAPATELDKTTLSITSNTNAPAYIEFDQHSEQVEETVRSKKSETVNEVLWNLFPNGFSDIFRFSYDAKPSISTLTTPTLNPLSTPTHERLSTSTSTAEAAPTNKTSYSYGATVSKEYRREIRPGHTQIVVEKLAISPTSSSGEFKDGSNSISKDDLLRINRAAVGASVLPSLLLDPAKMNTTNEHTLLTVNGPIVILNEDPIESSTEEDNQIAESQNEQQHVYQRLPDTINLYPYKGEYAPNKEEERQINVQIIKEKDNIPKEKVEDDYPHKLFPATKHLEVSASTKQPEVESSRGERALQNFDNIQDQVEKGFHQQNLVQEAPSRKFLKAFNPILSTGAKGPILKGNFHYENNTPRTVQYTEHYIGPAAQLEYQRQQQEQQQRQQKQHQEEQQTAIPPRYMDDKSVLHSHIQRSHPVASITNYENGTSTTPANDSDTPQSTIFVTINALTAPHQTAPSPASPITAKTAQEYVSEAAAAASQPIVQHAHATMSQSHGGYTFVEVQKSVNIHNKLITEKDGKLVEEHETIYPQSQPQYEPSPPLQQPHPDLQSQVAFSNKDYVSLSGNPINVQHIEYEGENQPELVSNDDLQHAAPEPIEPHQLNNYVEKIVETRIPYAVPQIFPVPVQHQYPLTHPIKQIIEKVVDRPVKVPYPVRIDHYIDRPYPVPEPVAVPVHIARYIDRPYPVETIVEKPVPYEVERVVEKFIEKEVPIEVERIVEKPVEKIVETFVDRPIAIPVHIPVAIPVPMAHSHDSHSSLLPNFHGHSNDFSFASIPIKVLQNYYARMVKKLIPQMTTFKTNPATTVHNKSKEPTKQPITASIPQSQTPKTTYRFTDIFLDLKPPPPPTPLGPNWSKGARYIYNTLPYDLDASAAAAPVYHSDPYMGPVPLANEHSDEFQRWRNGHSLKRSPEISRNLHVEYGFKPPLVPSLEIDDKGVPLNSGILKIVE